MKRNRYATLLATLSAKSYPKVRLPNSYDFFHTHHPPDHGASDPSVHAFCDEF